MLKGTMGTGRVEMLNLLRTRMQKLSILVGNTGKRYQLGALIGTGIGTGTRTAVYSAVEVGSDKKVAIKIFMPDWDKEELEQLGLGIGQKFEALSEIKSPHVAKVLDHGNSKEGQPFLVIEFLGAQTLEDRIDALRQTRAVMAPEMAVNIAIRIAEGLNDAAKASVTHGDVKPRNIFITMEDRGNINVVVSDFSLTQVLNAVPRKTILTESEYTGTYYLHYLAPEVTDSYINRAKIPPIKQFERSVKLDIYALGVILYEMLTGKRPFIFSSVSDFYAYALKAGDIRFFLEPRFTDKLFAVVKKMLARNHADRHADYSSLITDLKASLKS